jgi:hypothetical protein
VLEDFQDVLVPDRDGSLPSPPLSVANFTQSAAPSFALPPTAAYPPAAAVDAFPKVDLASIPRRRGRGVSNVSNASYASSCGTEYDSPSPVRKRSSEPEAPTPQRGRDRRRRAVEDSGKRSALIELTEEERLEKNRQSARDCRLRKKRYIEVKKKLLEFPYAFLVFNMKIVFQFVIYTSEPRATH